jgi:PIN domain nuclease of toxin-antitoxin system
MNLLLDTHTFIWCSIDPEQLSATASQLILDRNHTLFLSLASLWEMQIKLKLGKLQFDLPLSELLAVQQEINTIQLLPIELAHIWTLGSLPLHHRDPFDRMLITQATANQMPILSVDVAFDCYEIERLW